MPKQRILDNTTEYGKAMRRYYNKEQEITNRNLIKEEEDEYWEKWSDFVNNPLQMNIFENNLQKHFKECKEIKKSKKKLLFITLNWNEKLVTPTGTVNYVMKILEHPKVTKYYCCWEWRDNQAETGLHTHIILIGDTRRITEYCKRLKGPFIKLCSEYNTLKKYPVNYWEDKVKYLEGETDSEEKNKLKSGYKNLREKYALHTIIKE